MHEIMKKYPVTKPWVGAQLELPFEDSTIQTPWSRSNNQASKEDEK